MKIIWDDFTSRDRLQGDDTDMALNWQIFSVVGLRLRHLTLEESFTIRKPGQTTCLLFLFLGCFTLKTGIAHN